MKKDQIIVSVIGGIAAIIAVKVWQERKDQKQLQKGLDDLFKNYKAINF